MQLWISFYIWVTLSSSSMLLFKCETKKQRNTVYTQSLPCSFRERSLPHTHTFERQTIYICCVFCLPTHIIFYRMDCVSGQYPAVDKLLITTTPWWKETDCHRFTAIGTMCHEIEIETIEVKQKPHLEYLPFIVCFSTYTLDYTL